MPIPYLQVALDNLTLDSALDSTRVLADHVDVVECGTILSFGAGAPHAVRCLRALYPDKILVADLKVTDAGSVLAEMVFKAGANWLTVLCAAPVATMEKANEVAQKYKGEIQIELYGNWTTADAKDWYAAGARQAIYHRGRDAQAAGQGWSKEDIDKAKSLCDLGFEVSMTGGLEIADIAHFKGLRVKSFIVGRTLRDAPDPAGMAAAFKNEFARHWS